MMTLLKSIFISTLFTIINACVGGKDLYHTTLTTGSNITDAITNQINHDAWDKLLSQYVDTNGLVDYQGFATDHQSLKAYLQYLNTHAPDSTTSINEQLAYYINLYNAATINLILEHNIPSSIKDIKGPLGQVWLIEHVMINDQAYSLSAIEKNVLQQMGDPRIHFAINCASYSCPKLRNTAYRATNLNTLLDLAATEFINSHNNDLTNPSHPKLSKIFEWYESDFTQTGVNLIQYINVYAQQPIAPKASISYLDYNWQLNQQ